MKRGGPSHQRWCVAHRLPTLARLSPTTPQDRQRVFSPKEGDEPRLYAKRRSVKMAVFQHRFRLRLPLRSGSFRYWIRLFSPWSNAACLGWSPPLRSWRPGKWCRESVAEAARGTLGEAQRVAFADV